MKETSEFCHMTGFLRKVSTNLSPLDRNDMLYLKKLRNLKVLTLTELSNVL